MYTKISHVFVTLVLVLLGGIACRELLYPQHIVNVADYWGVDPEDIVAVAQEIGLEIDEVSGPYFVIDHYSKQFEAFEQAQGRPISMQEAEEMIVGYVAKCSISPSGITDYLYFSERVHPNMWFGARDIAMGASLFPDSSTCVLPMAQCPVSSIQGTNLGDTSIHPRSNTYWERCLAQYRSGTTAP